MHARQVTCMQRHPHACTQYRERERERDDTNTHTFMIYQYIYIGNMNATTKSGQTALMLACEHGQKCTLEANLGTLNAIASAGLNPKP